MGMGEPLNNYDAVVAACRAMVDPQLFGLAPGKVTVSTVGIVPRLHTLDSDLPGVNLALSLHAPNQQLRHSIMPSAQPFPLDGLMDAVDGYCTRSRQKVFVQYIMLGGVNDELAHAEQLGELLADRAVATVNLIPYNPTGVGVAFSTSPEETVTEFQMTLRRKYRINTTVRQQMGQDIDGACGQLVIAATAAVAAPGACASGGGAAAAGAGSGLRDIEDISSGPACHAEHRPQVPTAAATPAAAAESAESAAAVAASVEEFLARGVFITVPILERSISNR
jgi:hypothetical protein